MVRKGDTGSRDQRSGFIGFEEYRESSTKTHQFTDGELESELSEVIKKQNSFQLKLLRRSKGITQVELAQILGVTQIRISQIENGSFENINLSTLNRYLAALDSHLELQVVSDGERYLLHPPSHKN